MAAEDMVRDAIDRDDAVKRAIKLELSNWRDQPNASPNTYDEFVQFFFGVIVDLRHAEGYELRKVK